jgi:hypothetical protein
MQAGHDLLIFALGRVGAIRECVAVENKRLRRLVEDEMLTRGGGIALR